MCWGGSQEEVLQGEPGSTRGGCLSPGVAGLPRDPLGRWMEDWGVKGQIVAVISACASPKGLGLIPLGSSPGTGPETR